MTPSPLMPDFTSATHAFHHTLDSALATLAKLKVSPARITVNMDGRGYPTRQIVSQAPEAGTPLQGGLPIVLRVAGTGMFHALPVGMWDKGGEAEPGTYEIIGAFDDPFQKAANWMREGARLFDVQPDNDAACGRWISLFGLNPDAWPPELWYDLAILLPNINSLAGKEYGIRFVLSLLLSLPLHQIRRARAYSYLDPDKVTLLGNSYSRLGLDAALGNRTEELARLTLVLGPIPLRVYYSFQSGANQLLLRSVLDLIMPIHQKRAINWLVLNSAHPPRLGFEAENARLGINSHLGSALWPSEDEVTAQ